MQGEDSSGAAPEDSIPLISIHSCENSPGQSLEGPTSAGPMQSPCLLLVPRCPEEGPQQPPRHLTAARPSWDYVFVTSLHQKPQKQHRLQKLLEELARKGFQYKEMQYQHKKYFGIRAKDTPFLQHCQLLMAPEGSASRAQLATDSTLETTRIRLIYTFIEGSAKTDDEDFYKLKKARVFEDGFFLHTMLVSPKEGPGEGPGGGPRPQLTKTEEKLRKWAQWRSMFKVQPVDAIRDYFGEKVALYFAWLGWYTCMLVPAALVGLIVFLSGFALFDASQISKEICEAHHIILCPRGDHFHEAQRLSDTCTFAKLTHLFDNEGTVVFAIFMALWATVFLEVWKRQRASVVQHWNLCGWDEVEDEMVMEMMNCPEYEPKNHRHSYLHSALVLFLSLVMICVMIGMAHILVVYRVLAAALFSYWASPLLAAQVTTVVVVSGALVHYVTIVIMTKINRCVALKLSEFEKPRSFSERESKFTVKFFMLQFFTHFSSLIYIAFILGRINGHPGKSVRLAGLWKLEECHLSGCMMDLFVQMAVIMGLKQTLSNCMEYLSPWFRNKWRSYNFGHLSNDPELKEWQRNYLLDPVTTFSLFDEFMEMMMQYGFTTLFVAAFPLAPLLALISNLVEIRLDAIKMVRLQRRLIPRKAKDIGTWLQVLETIGVLAVISNGLVIAVTSEFIPRVVYKYHYGPCQLMDCPPVDCLAGYVNHSLSVFQVKDFERPLHGKSWETVTECRYRDYRDGHEENYSLSKKFWFLLAIRLVFLILFEHVALCIKLIAAWFVPDVPQKVKNRVLVNKFKRVKEKMHQETHRPQSEGPEFPSASSSFPKSTAVAGLHLPLLLLGHLPLRTCPVPLVPSAGAGVGVQQGDLREEVI
ncbi:anoctamin-9 [Tenrec ecaudatus]|uniref:anoctamin-9 n=1 Tax=Tenrec ecaudatus TaxID=94439 RepID=UPI003F59C5E3